MVLAGQVAVVTGAGTPLADGLAAGLRDAGATVTAVGGDRLRSRADAEAAFAEAGAPVDALVHAFVDDAAAISRPLAEVDSPTFDAAWEGTMQAALFAMQAAFGQMRGRGGRILVVTPTASMSGAAQLVPYTMAVEGLRLLAKSAARQWGADGITVNCLAPAPEVALGDAAPPAEAVSLAPPALGRTGNPQRDLGPVAAWLIGPDAGFVTGITVCADGGVWMAP
jgi:3-oxoacyl-[acyl-carrier protein] reductase